MSKIDLRRVPVRVGTNYPAPYDEPCRARVVRKLGDAAGLRQFGANLVELPPGAWSSQRHWHSHEDEFIYLLEGEAVLVTGAGEETMRPGDCVGFLAGTRDGHHLQNRSAGVVRFLVVGTRVEGDHGEYSDVDLAFSAAGYTRKDGSSP